MNTDENGGESDDEAVVVLGKDAKARRLLVERPIDVTRHTKGNSLHAGLGVIFLEQVRTKVNGGAKGMRFVSHAPKRAAEKSRYMDTQRHSSSNSRIGSYSS